MILTKKDLDPVKDVATSYEAKKMERLTFLIEQSKVYSTIMAERLADSLQGSINDESGTKSRKRCANDVQKTDKRRKGQNQRYNITESAFKQPKLLTGATLHDYQLEGVGWLKSLYENGLNGILADDMGLGKTIQTIAFLSFMIENNVSGPFLIVSPLATLDHWCEEFKHYAPSVTCTSYYGSKEQRRKVRANYLNKNVSDKPAVIVTTYEMVINDSQNLCKYKWKYLVVDEGHRIKNINSVLIQKLKNLKTSSRLLLSGTPLQNNMTELWTLLNFLMPEIFSDIDIFESWFDSNSEANLRTSAKAHTTKRLFNSDPNIVDKLHDILRPFLLRRLKSRVLSHLPPKREYTIYTKLTPVQLQLYEEAAKGSLREFLEEELLKAHDPNGEKGFREKDGKVLRRFNTTCLGIKVSDRNLQELSKKRRTSRQINYEEPLIEENNRKNRDAISVNNSESIIEQDYLLYQKEKRILAGCHLENSLIALRYVCDSPLLLNYPYNLPPDEELGLLLPLSSKMQVLDKLCRSLIARGHRILIFSQFLSMMDILEDWANGVRGWKSCRIDGTTSFEERQASMTQFNNDSSYKLFMLSTRAGGLGINLVSADTVILFDSDWNPQCDLQAMDRAYRIGQKKPVIVYRLATAHTIEQHLLQAAGKKRELERTVIEQGDFSGFTKRSNGRMPKYTATLNQMMDYTTNPRQIEKVREASKSDYTISPEALEALLDRSEGAYAREVTNLPPFIIPTETLLHEE